MSSEATEEAKLDRKATDELALLDALTEAQASMGKVAKSGYNKHTKAKYPTFEDIHAATVPKLNAMGIFYSAHIVTDTCITTFRKGFAIMACEIPLIVGKQDAQGYRSAVTYARKAGLELLSGISTCEDDDDGHAAAQNPPQQQQEQPPQQPPQVDPGKLETIFGKISGITTQEQLNKAEAYVVALGWPREVMDDLREQLDNKKQELENWP